MATGHNGRMVWTVWPASGLTLCLRLLGFGVCQALPVQRSEQNPTLDEASGVQTYDGLCSGAAYNALLGTVCGLFLSPWLILLVCVVVDAFYRPRRPEAFFKILVAAGVILCGMAGLIFGLRWGGQRLEGRARKRGLAAIAGGLAGIPAGFLCAMLTGFLKSALFTVPACVILGMLLGAAVYGLKPTAPPVKRDPQSGSEQ